MLKIGKANGFEQMQCKGMPMQWQGQQVLDYFKAGAATGAIDKGKELHNEISK